MVAEADDTLMETFFDAGTLSQDELVIGLKRSVAAGRIFPVLCTSATLNIGIQALLNAIVGYVPAPSERPFAATSLTGQEAAQITAATGGPAAAFVWKTVAIHLPGESPCSGCCPGLSSPTRRSTT